jgi:hypothetical protein
MANFTTNFSATEVNSKKLEGQKNPLSGKVEEVQSKFDALPLLVKQKLEALINELNDKLSNVENTADKDKPLSDDGVSKLKELEETIGSSITALKNELNSNISTEIAKLVGKAPDYLNTLEEIAKSIATIDESYSELCTSIDNVETVQEKIQASINGILSEIDDEINKMFYGTTDVYILTEDDVYIDVDHRITGQKIDGTIEHDVIIIPEGITEIVNVPIYYDDNEGKNLESSGLDLKADKIILPSTLTNLSTLGEVDVMFSLDGELVLNKNIKSIDITGPNASDTLVKKIVINSSLKNFILYQGGGFEIVIPENINSLNVRFGGYFLANMYVYNPDFDFKDFEIGRVDEIDTNGIIHGYAGSTAEEFAKVNNIKFVNIGSDYSAELKGLSTSIGNIDEALDGIIAIQNELIGGDDE